MPGPDDALIFDPARETPPAWRLISDGVMGGVSDGSVRRETVAGRPAVRLRGAVRLENDGGFVQIARDLAPDGTAVDARGWHGIALDVIGNGASYNLHLRTPDIARPWQSYRHSFVAGPEWRRVELPFAAFTPHRIAAPLDIGRLRRIGIVAIGRAFDADVAVGVMRFYADERP